jgi:hypothetical protein
MLELFLIYRLRKIQSMPEGGCFMSSIKSLVLLTAVSTNISGAFAQIMPFYDIYKMARNVDALKSPWQMLHVGNLDTVVKNQINMESIRKGETTIVDFSIADKVESTSDTVSYRLPVGSFFLEIKRDESGAISEVGELYQHHESQRVALMHVSRNAKEGFSHTACWNGVSSPEQVRCMTVTRSLCDQLYKNYKFVTTPAVYDRVRHRQTGEWVEVLLYHERSSWQWVKDKDLSAARKLIKELKPSATAIQAWQAFVAKAPENFKSIKGAMLQPEAWTPVDSQGAGFAPYAENQCRHFIAALR